MRQIDALTKRQSAGQVVVDLDKSAVKSQLVGEENPVNGDLEGFSHAGLHVNLDHLPSFPFALNEGALFGNGFVTVHVQVDLFRGWIVVVPKHYLLGDSHASLPVLRHPPRMLPRPLSAQPRFIDQPVRDLSPVMVVGIVHRARELGFELVSKSMNARSMLALTIG
jgi:hypothetical protein